MRLPTRLDRLEAMTKVGGCDHCRHWPNPHTSWEKVVEGGQSHGPSGPPPVCPFCRRQISRVHIIVEQRAPQR